MKPYLQGTIEKNPIRDDPTNPGATDVTGTHPAILSTVPFWLPAQQFTPKVGMKYSDRSDEIRSTLDPLPGYAEAFDPSWDYKMRAYPNLMGFFMGLWAGDWITAAGNGIILDPDGIAVPAGATRHIFQFKMGTPNILSSTSQLVPRTAQFVSADDPTNGPYDQYNGCAVESMTLQGTRAALDMQVKGKMLYYNRITDPGLTPALPAIANLPWNTGQMTLTWLTSSAVTSAFQLDFEQKLNWFNDLSAPSLYPTAVELDKGYRSLKGTIDKRTITSVDWDAFYKSSTFAAKAVFNSRQMIGATAATYKMWIDMPNCVYSKMDEGALEESPRRANKLDWVATHGGTGTMFTAAPESMSSDYAVRVCIVNSTTSYYT